MTRQKLLDLLSSIDQEVRSQPDNGLIGSKEIFEEIVHRKLHLASLNKQLEAFSRDISSVDIFTSGKFLILETLDEIELTLIRYSGKTENIYSSPVDFMQSKMSHGSFVVDYYECDFSIVDALFSTGMSIRHSATELVSDARPVLKSLNDITDLHSFTNKPTVFLRLSQKPKGDFEWAFDRGSLKSKFHSTLRLAESNLCGLFDLIAEIDDPRSKEILGMFAEHDYHFVRWKAVQAIGRCDSKLGLELAQLATKDPHPHVRQAAVQTLENIGAQLASKSDAGA